ncbi:hypothetical protein [Pseudomarimonas arenosa]|uniref:Glycosyltransferase RgtA/B/C/D-like domain-containing protein n=1 Tax=Pseudomarimonas arenosa TaxID=2774145 RepID=A0AAW3ZMH4_9GAMM|nr:hypothetical protein [Pseudomarimonas arenosa]MBD8527325.1 hypothetical protein [Pseudomarimonas arenosa]
MIELGLALLILTSATLLAYLLLAGLFSADPAVGGVPARLGEAYLLAVLGGGVGLSLLGEALIPGPSGLFVLTGVAVLFLVSTLTRASGRQRVKLFVGRARWRPSWPALLGAALLLIIGIQALSLPTLTWDAWNTWLAKSKAWVHAGQFVSVLPIEAWLGASDPQSIHVVAHVYPEALPRSVAFLVAATGDWSDRIAHLPWPLLWLALGGVMWGGLAALSLDRRARSLICLGLLTLPLVTAHASLAGYADLWLSAVLLAAAVPAMRYFLRRQRRELCHALLFVALLPAVKQEGGIYAGLFLIALLLAHLPWRHGLLLLVVAPLLVTALIYLTPVSVPIPGVGWLRLAWGSVEVPDAWHMALFWRPVSVTVLSSLFLLPNWSLLWYLTPVLLIWRFRTLAAAPTRFLFLLFALSAQFHFVLFFFTDASAWAQDLTSLNRLLLHTAAIQVLLLAALGWQRSRCYGRYTRPELASS